MTTLPYYASAHIYGVDLDPSPYHPDWDRLVVQLQGALGANHGIEGWFFVRYRDPDPHIRLRIRLPESKPAYTTRSVLRQAVAPLGIIEQPLPGSSFSRSRRSRWMTWSPYQREVERYGGQSTLLLVEQIFEATSVSVANHLSRNLSEGPAARLSAAASMAYELVTEILGGRTELRIKPFAQLSGHTAFPVSQVLVTHEPLFLELREILSRKFGTFETAPLTIPSSGIVDIGASNTGQQIEFGYSDLRSPSSSVRLRREPLLLPCLPSLVHMLWNRMGLTREMETLLAREIALAIKNG